MIKKSTFSHYFGLIIFKLLLDYSYCNLIVKKFSYEGYDFEPTKGKIFLGWICYFLGCYALRNTKKHVLEPSLYLFFLLSFVPTMTIFSYGSIQAKVFFITFFAYFLFFKSISKRTIKLPKIKNGEKIVIYTSIFLVLTVVLRYLWVIGIFNINFDLSKVYDFRERFDNNSAIFRYLNNWVAKILNIFLISYFLFRKNYTAAIVFVFVQILIFGFTGHKINLFSLLLVLFFYKFRNYKNLPMAFVYVFFGFIFLSLFLFYRGIIDIMIPSIFVRRVFFVPVFLNDVYIEFFDKNPFIYWSNGILKSFSTYPYGEINSSHVIGAYLGHPKMGANTGIIGSGYMHMGVFGVIFYFLIIRVFFTLINGFKSFPKWLINSVLLLPILSLFTASDLFTSFLTHGLLISLLILILAEKR